MTSSSSATSSAADLFLGFGAPPCFCSSPTGTCRADPAPVPPADCSTQGLKVVACDSTLQVVQQAGVNFSTDLPSFGTKSGVHLESGGVVNAPVEMYIQAIDLLMERLQAACVSSLPGQPSLELELRSSPAAPHRPRLTPRDPRPARPRSKFDFGKVVSISGAGQQHACVLFNARAPELLRSLSPALPLGSQLSGAFSSPTVTNWQDSSTTAECAALEAALPGGREELARLTGSKAHERFTGPQIRKLVTRGVGSVWDDTAKIALVSNALATILCADGEIKPYDEVRSFPSPLKVRRAISLGALTLSSLQADACGMNLFSCVSIPALSFPSPCADVRSLRFSSASRTASFRPSSSR